MVEFGSKYAKGRTAKDQRKKPTINNGFGRKQGNNDIFQQAGNAIVLQEKEELNVKDESHEKIDDKFNGDELYELEK